MGNSAFSKLFRRLCGRPYDLAFSLGAACACSKCLRDAGLQFASFPFDWISGGTAEGRARLVAARFAGWLEAADFVYEGHNEMNGLGRFLNRKTRFHHLHDFADAPVEASLGAVAEKYRRRETRLLRLLAAARRVLVLCIDTTTENGEPSSYVAPGELEVVQSTLAQAFPHARFDVVHFAYVPGVPFAARRTARLADGLTEISFDYRNPATNVRFADVVKVLLGDLRVFVRDYRTRAERKAYRLRRREKRRAKLRM